MARAADTSRTRRPSLTLAAPLFVVALTACPHDEILIVGEFGRPLPLGSGDASPLPRLVYRPDGCPGEDAAGGCTSVCTTAPESCPPDACLPLVVDSGSPITTLVGDGPPTAVRGCFEVRTAAEALAEPPIEGAAEQAIARFRFDSTPYIRLPPATADVSWGWQVGDGTAAPFVGGVLGGNVLRQMAVRFTDARGNDGPQITFYREFPGVESALADQGSAALPLQFPGLLLGKLIDDVCQQPDGDDCDLASFGVFDRNHPESALQSTRMVLDACLGAPPAAVVYSANSNSCELASGPGKPGSFRSPTGVPRTDLRAGCGLQEFALPADDIDHGHDASVLIATGLPGLVLFEDSAQRMFGSLDLPPCFGDGGLSSGVQRDTPACLIGQTGQLRAAGWPPAGTAERPLIELRVRSLALVPGLTQTTGQTACQRLEVRLRALRSQCNMAAREKVPRTAADNCRSATDNLTPGSAGFTSAAVVGQAFVASDGRVDPNRWLPTLVVPADHPLASAVRRDTSPEALQLDGLVGTALLRGTDVVLDYTDPTPSVRVACTDPDDGSCLAMPACVPRDDPRAVVPACCYGLPEDLLVSLIRDHSAYGCCAALSPATVDELNNAEAIAGRELPCPVRGR
ncbi:hypothetical protein OV090_25380 [Nannocystis sp. RBIL2]|uniref:hypothetical protein n=1 Tax=Nannocystis sp. RBIL2 TaxID=2996788 RepID=UPI00226DE479|nr:hypothetical protein [Nannocystis sp. RBIL2]MCY1068100.1 hypothetical protein [Nannocystis sp. RBIL2]